MKDEWDNLAEADRLAFADWNEARKNPPAPKYGEMTDAERAAFRRKVGLPAPRRGSGQ